MACEFAWYHEKQQTMVSCGHCMSCRIKKRKEWTLRGVLESLLVDQNVFVTLTYATPPSRYVDKRTGELFTGDTVHPKHLSDFWKRLRKRYPELSIRYLSVGEYGDDSGRPHYHAIIHGYPNCYYGKSRYSRVVKNCCPACDSIRDLWAAGYPDDSSAVRGNVYLAPANPTTVQYVCGYTMKKMTSRTDDRLDGRYPEFRTSSLSYGSHAMPLILAGVPEEKILSLDLPEFLRHNGKKWPLGKYLTSKLIGELDVEEEIKQKNLSRVAEEMQALRKVAQEAYPRSIHSSPAALASVGYKLKNDPVIFHQKSRENFFKKEKKI